MKVVGITSTIQVTDLSQAIEYYEKLGFQKDWLWPDSGPTHASVSQNGFSLMMVRVEEQAHIQRADLYFRMEAVKPYHKHLASVLDIPDLILSAYGMLDFSINDPWGHHLTFGSPEGDFEQS